jgi:hypothetical protein
MTQPVGPEYGLCDLIGSLLGRSEPNTQMGAFQMIINVIPGMDEGPCRYKYQGTGVRNPHVTLPPCTTLNIVVARNIVLCCTFLIGCYCCSYFVPYSNNLNGFLHHYHPLRLL